jgi:hypothetical protein
MMDVQYGRVAVIRMEMHTKVKKFTIFRHEEVRKAVQQK